MRPLVHLLAAAAVLLSGCVPALEPFYSHEDLVTDPALLGTWRASPGEEIWRVVPSGETSLIVTVDARGARKTFDGHLFRIGPHRFLDLLPRIPVGEEDVHWAHYVPAHTVARVWLEDDLLKVAPLSRDWLATRLERGEISIEHRRTESGVVLTAPTTELRELLAAFGDDPDAFPAPTRCDRRPATHTLCISGSASGRLP